MKLGTIALILFGLGCTSEKDNLRITIQEDPELAREKNQEAVRLLEERKYAEAEKVLLEAVAADRSSGAVHNNLGKAYYHQDKFYPAAGEFERAAQLMPNAAEPRNNLGMVYEKVGRWDSAVEQYAAARKLDESNVEILGNLTRARIRRGDKGGEIRTLLQQVILMDTRPDWQEWARRQLAEQ